MKIRDWVDAVVFDLDGVVTLTASVHAAAWKRLFDEYLDGRAAKRGEPFVPFEIESDYHTYVDGKPRIEGVRSFLASRGIELPPGSPEDGPNDPTAWGLGNRKNGYFREVLEDLRDAVCEILTLGQYLQPTQRHLPVERYLHPDEFADLKQEALALGFRHVESGPLVRSSYRAWAHVS